MEIAWITGECGVGQGTAVCSRTDQGIEQDVGYRNEVVNSVPPTNRWADRTYEPRVGTVLEVLHGSLAEGLARVFSRGRVRSK